MTARPRRIPHERCTPLVCSDPEYRSGCTARELTPTMLADARERFAQGYAHGTPVFLPPERRHQAPVLAAFVGLTGAVIVLGLMVAGLVWLIVTGAADPARQPTTTPPPVMPHPGVTR